MNAAARLLALVATALAGAAPLIALAQAVDPSGGPRNHGWLWLVAAAIVVVALFRLFSARSRRPPTAPPPAP